MLISAVTFDVYGTLVQWHEAIERALAEIVGEMGVNVPVATLKAEFRASQGPLQQGGP